MEIRPVGVELFHTDRRTNVTKVTVFFCSFVNRPKIKVCTISYI